LQPKTAVLKNHFKSKRHQKNEFRRRQEQQDAARVVRGDEFVLDVVFMLAQAGVSLEKLDTMKPFFEKWVPDYAGLIPTGGHARRFHLPRLLPFHEASVKSVLAGMLGCSIIADESTDKRKMSPVNMLIAPAKEAVQSPVLADIMFVNESESPGENINGMIMEEFVLKLCEHYEIKNSLVDAFVCDGASYNLAAYNRLKESLNEAMICVWCVCHMLERVGDAVTKMPELKEVKRLLSDIKKLFTKSRQRRSKWIAHLKANGVQNPTQISRYGKTRWGSWFETAFDVLQYLQHIPSFLGSLPRGKVTRVCNRLKTLLSDPTVLLQIRLKLALLQDLFAPMVALIQKYQGHRAYAHKLVDDVMVFRSTLATRADSSDFSDLLFVSQFARDQPLQKLTLEQVALLNTISTVARTKLDACISKHPSWNFFKAARIFDPYYVAAHGVPEQFETFIASNIPFAPTDLTILNGIAAEYCQFARWVRVGEAIQYQSQDQFDIFAFWLYRATAYPALRKLALRVLSVPVSSADAERSFSAYNYIVNHKRTSMSNDSVRAHVLLANNKNIKICG